MLTRRKSGAASALVLTLLASVLVAASSGVAVVGKREPLAPVVTAKPADPLAELFNAPTKAACAANVAALAAIVADDNDPRHEEAILALGVAATPEAREALRRIEQFAGAADAQLAADVLAGASGSIATR